MDETSVYNWESNRIEPAVRLIPRIHLFLGYCPYTLGLPLSGQLKMWRQSLGFSQERMAKEIGVNEGMLRRWEAGERSPTQKYLETIRGVVDRLASSAK